MKVNMQIKQSQIWIKQEKLSVDHAESLINWRSKRNEIPRECQSLLLSLKSSFHSRHSCSVWHSSSWWHVLATGVSITAFFVINDRSTQTWVTWMNEVSRRSTPCIIISCWHRQFFIQWCSFIQVISSRKIFTDIFESMNKLVDILEGIVKGSRSHSQDTGFPDVTLKISREEETKLDHVRRKT